MRNWQFLAATGLAVATLVLVFALMAVNGSAQALQMELARQQEEINRGNLSQQIGANLVREMGGVAVRNEKMREVLSRNGYTLQQQPTQQPATQGGAR